jgi:hypothetical protein
MMRSRHSVSYAATWWKADMPHVPVHSLQQVRDFGTGPFSAYAALQKGVVSVAAVDPMKPFFTYALFPVNAPQPSLPRF